MGRPEPCVLFSQTFVHSKLDEYVDEVIFSEPVVVSSCEFLEQNASSASQTVALIGATSPPSFALEVFVHCEGETKFRRFCQPFLYSHSSSNVLEVEAIVTNHMVVRGSYRSLSIVIYGNKAEDLGQLNIEVDLDASLTNTVSVVEEILEDLPYALRQNNRSTEKPISSLIALSVEPVASDISMEIKHFLHLTSKILRLPNLGDALNKLIDSVVSVALRHATPILKYVINREKQFTGGRVEKCDAFYSDLTETRKELVGLYNNLHVSGSSIAEISGENFSCEFELELATSKQLMDIFSEQFNFSNDLGNNGHPQLSRNKGVFLWLSVALLLCSSKESCFHFVNGGGMKQLGYIFCRGIRNSSAVTLMLLGVIEQATRQSIGCEGFLGWWPREDENVPNGVSEGYNQLLKLLLQKQRHDVASLSTFVLHRIRFYEVAARYEYAVLSVLGSLSSAGKVTSVAQDMLSGAKHQLKKLLKLIGSYGPVEDPSPVAHAKRSLLLGEAENLLSYKATSTIITASPCCFSNRDIDLHLLFLLKERGFLPLSAALLASSILRSEVGHVMDLYSDIISSIEAIVLSLLRCRSGLLFLLLDCELVTTMIHALRGSGLTKDDSIPLCYASVLISKGFFCRPQEVGMIVEMHLRIVMTVDRLISSKPQSEELLWSLWELCNISRSNCGRQALMALVHFPEAVDVLMSALHSVKEFDTVSVPTGFAGASPLNLAIFHSAVEVFEIIVTDSTASSLGSWIGHAKELHRALLSSSPGSSRKDAPTRLLEWVDASVVYHRTGASGLLRYAALLASGGDAHIAASNILESDTMDAENDAGDFSGSSDGNLIDNLLGKPINETRFPGVTLRDSSVAQLTTSCRILALLSDNSAVAADLYYECAVTVIHAILIDCTLMLERSSNNYDYLVDEGTECNSTSDLLLERNREQSLVDLLIPSLVLLISLFKKLQDAKEQHRNTKLLKTLLQLHREVSPKLAACSADLFYPYPDFALGLEAVCHLLASSLACWPLYGWSPGLFHFLFDSLQATSMLSLGPKETCSLLFLLNDLLPEEAVWVWKNGMPMLSALRKLAVGTLLGPEKEREINWYLQARNPEKLLSQLTTQLEKIAQIILHYATSTLVVIQDMLRVFIVRMACLSANNASILIQPMILGIRGHVSDLSSSSDIDADKVYRLLDFLAVLLEHPSAKPLLLKEGVVQVLSLVLDICIGVTSSDASKFLESKILAKYGPSLLSWCTPVFKSISLVCDSRTPVQYSGMYDRYNSKSLTSEDCLLLLTHCLRFCMVLPAGTELLACLLAFKELVFSDEGRSALNSIYLRTQSSGIHEPETESKYVTDGNHNLVSAFELKKQPPLLCCWLTLLRSISTDDVLQVHVIEAVGLLSSSALHFCLDGKSINMERVVAVKYFFGLSHDFSGSNGVHEKNLRYIEELTSLLTSISENEYSAAADMSTSLKQVKKSSELLLLLLQKTSDFDQGDGLISIDFPLSLIDIPSSSKLHMVTDSSAKRVKENSLSGFGDKFIWECPENLRDGISQAALTAKRKMSSVDGISRRPRGDNSPAENMGQSAFSRGSVPAAPSVPSRRDTFRQRKPNTSRPPSMHVDDYVARERNVDGTSSSNVIAVPRLGPTSGRPPSIHVDEFMARQRERQNPVGLVVNETATRVKAAPPKNVADTEEVGKSLQLKPDLDDDLQGIDIVFDGEESDSDDKLPFPQPDDNLKQPSSVVVEQNSPHSVVAETESDLNENNQFSHLVTPSASNFDENNRSEFSSRMSVSRPDVSLTREPSVSSDKKYYVQTEEAENVAVATSAGFDSAAKTNSSPFSASMYNKRSGPSVQPFNSRMHHPSLYPKNNRQQVSIGSQGFNEHNLLLNQPPLPPMPPPPTISPVMPQTAEPVPSPSSLAEVNPPLPPGFHLRMEYSSSSLVSSNSLRDSKYARATCSSPGGSSRPQPPLPPTPPPYSVNPSTLQPFRTSTSQSSVYNQFGVGSTEFLQTPVAPSDARSNNLPASGGMLSSYPPPLVPPLIFSRPPSIPVSIYGSSSNSHQGDNPSSISPNLPMALSSIHSIQSLAQLQPLQPPQLPRSLQPPQHLRPPITASPQSEQGVSLLQSPVQLQLQQLQMVQPPQVSSAHVYYPSMQQDSLQHTMQLQRVENTRPQAQHQQKHGTPQPEDDIGMSLQHYFSSPEAIQSLLSDRDKLCQLLEQHPKLMQMLQERLGQL